MEQRDMNNYERKQLEFETKQLSNSKLWHANKQTYFSDLY